MIERWWSPIYWLIRLYRAVDSTDGWPYALVATFIIMYFIGF